MSAPKIFFPKGTTVKITKTTIKQGHKSSVEVGFVMIGRTKEDVKEGNSVELDTGGGTSIVQKITETKSNDLVLETETSTYFLQAIV